MTLDDASAPSSAACHACAVPFQEKASQAGAPAGEGVSPLGRYRCPVCARDFCTDCDVFVHDVLHCCPGCGK